MSAEAMQVQGRFGGLKNSRTGETIHLVVAEERHDSTQDVGVFTATTEALYGHDPDRATAAYEPDSEVPSNVSDIFDAVYAAELDHWNFISQHYRPSTKRFWIPDGFFGGAGDALDLTAVGKGVSGGEKLFINTYLVAVTTFADAGRSEFARYWPRSPEMSPSIACLDKRSPAQIHPTTRIRRVPL